MTDCNSEENIFVNLSICHFS